MAFHCFKCGSEIAAPSGGRFSRSDSCDSCRSDVHVCKNCRHFDEKAYNHCLENQAERVLDKERSNYCDFFSFRDGARQGTSKPNVDYIKGLDDLFKK